MKRSLLLVWMIILALTVAAQAPKAPKKQTSWTGCIDQRDDKFVLTDDKELKPIAELLDDDPERSSFAKHLGHKVAIEGVIVSSGELPKIRVRRLKTISETCEPQ